MKKALILLAILLTGCSSTSLVENWKNPDIVLFHANKVLIVGMASNEEARTDFETSMLKEFSKRNVDAMRSLDVFDVSFTDTRKTEKELDDVEQSLLDKDFDAILFTKVVGSEDKESFLKSISRWNNYQGRFNDDYLSHQDIYYDQGYYDKFTVYHAETTLYCICEGKERSMIWRGSIDISDPQNIQKTIKDYIKLVVMAMEDQDLIFIKEEKMKLLVYSAKDFEIPFLNNANNKIHKVTYTTDALNSETAIQAVGHMAVSIFSGDDASSLVLENLSDLGVRYISLRSAGYNNVHLKTAHKFGIKVANVPEYSPYSIAEHAIAQLQALNRKIILADRQVHAYNFLQSNLMGFDLNKKTVGIVGTGKIGSVMAKIMNGFGCKILANDLKPDYILVQQYDLTYTSLDELCKQSDIISLHIPLSQENYYLIDKQKLALMKPGVILINTARGALVETKALINALEKKAIGGYCTDVYEKEIGSFFKDNSKDGIKDTQLMKLLSFPNVLLTPHQGFITKEALTNIAEVTFENLNSWEEGKPSKNELVLETISS